MEEDRSWNVEPLRAVMQLMAHQPERVVLVKRPVQQRGAQRRQRIGHDDAGDQSEAGQVEEMMTRPRRRQQRREQRRDDARRDQARKANQIPELDWRISTSWKQPLGHQKQDEGHRNQEPECLRLSSALLLSERDRRVLTSGRRSASRDYAPTDKVDVCAAGGP